MSDLVDRMIEWIQEDDKLRRPFPPERTGLLPKPYKKDSDKGTCSVCGKWHGLPALHLDYVGHGAITERLLEVDPNWTWEPLATEDGIPKIVQRGGDLELWIRLTIGDRSKIGVGSCPANQFDAAKVLIGDALRNAAMRFGVALDLWIKGEDHDNEPGERIKDKRPPRKATYRKSQPSTTTTETAPVATQPAPDIEIVRWVAKQKLAILDQLGGDKDKAKAIWAAVLETYDLTPDQLPLKESLQFIESDLSLEVGKALELEGQATLVEAGLVEAQ